MPLHGTYPTNTPEKGHGVAQYSSFTTTTWYHLAWREWGGTGNPLCSSLCWGAQGHWWLLSPALSIGSGVLLLTVVLSWDSPRLC